MSRVSKNEAPRTRAEQKKDTRERIRQAAWELFRTKGFDETTTKEIAERAGVATGTVFVHASDKEDLLHLCMHDRLADVIEERFARLPDAPLVDQVLFVFEGFFRMYSEDPGVAAAFVRTVHYARGPNAQRVAAITFGFLGRIATLVTAAQARGEVTREVDSVQCAQNFFALYYMGLATWLSGYATLETALEPGLRNALLLQMRGMRP
jgi:AcrR family transcriptional regulator